MGDRKTNIVIRVVQWLLKEWVKALLAAIAILFLGFLGWFRNYIQVWIVSSHAIKLVGWLWILVFSLISATSTFLFWLITRKSKQIRYQVKYTNEVDIKNILTDYWNEEKARKDEKSRFLYELRSEFVIDCFRVERQLSLKKGSAARFLPEIIENDDIYYIKSKGEKTIVVRRKGLTIRAGPNGPY
jgi:hypothetical protein